MFNIFFIRNNKKGEKEYFMNFKESKTKECLARAFAGVCQDGARLQFIAKSAEKENMFFISLQIKEIAKNKMAHASIIYNAMLKELSQQKENINIEAGYPFESQKLNSSLKDSAEIEEYEAKNIYTHFAKIAKDEGYEKIEKIFKLIAISNINNSKKLNKLAIMFDNKSIYKSNEKIIWECSNCGYTEESKQAWDYCPLCSYPKGYVKFDLNNINK